MSTTPRVTSRYKIEVSDTVQSINGNSGSFTAVASFSDFSILHKLQFRFNNSSIIVKIVIDDEEVCEFDTGSISNLFGDKDIDRSILSFDSSSKVLTLKPNYPIMVRSNLTVLAKASSNSSSRSCLGYVIERTLE